MKAPMAGPPRRPRRVRVADEQLAAEVRAAAPDIEVVVAPTPELDAVVELMAATLPEAEEASYLEDGTIGEEVVADLFAGALILYHAAPWKMGADQQLLRLDIPALGVHGACVATMGALGEAEGVNIFPSLGHFGDFMEAIASMADDAGEFIPPDEGADVDFGSRVLSLNFVAADELPDRMLQEANEHGWKATASGLYPWPQNRAPDAMAEPLGEWRMQALAALCGAFSAFSVKYGDLFEGESFEPICESFINDDDLEVRLTMPYEAWPLFEVNEPPAPERFEGDASLQSRLSPERFENDASIQPPPSRERFENDASLQPPPSRASIRPPAPSRPQVGRNDPCPCGSGKKYKRCCLDRDTRSDARRTRESAAAASEGLLHRVLSWTEGAGDDAADWDARRRQVLGEHLGDALESYGAEIEELPDLLGDDLAGAIFAWVIEGLMTRRLWRTGADMSMIDVFLARRGKQLDDRDARFLEALNASSPGLYEVLHVRPGEGLVLADLVRGGEPIEVVERSGSAELLRWDCFAARVLELDGRKVLSGALLRFSGEGAERATAVIEKALNKTARPLRKMRGPSEATSAEFDRILRDEVLTVASPLLSTVWLIDTLRALAKPPPSLVNFDGEPVVVARVRLPLHGDPTEVCRVLDACRELQRHGEEMAWSWIVGPEEAASSTAPKMPGGGHPIRGFVELVRAGGGRGTKKRKRAGKRPRAVLLLETNSRERGERGKKLLEELLGDQVGSGLLEIEDVEQATFHAGPTESSLPPEVQAEARRQFNERHLREWLDTEIPALDGKTPRRAVRSKAGRQRVLRLLKDIERGEHAAARELGVEPYDVSWMWEELRLEAYRPEAAS
jgi:hypothetical protein